MFRRMYGAHTPPNHLAPLFLSPTLPTHPQIYEAVLSIQQGRLGAATELVRSARRLIQPDIVALASESYSRAYPLVVKLQVLSELEEVAAWLGHGGIEAHEPDQVDALLKVWRSRLFATERRTGSWGETLALRSLLVWNILVVLSRATTTKPTQIPPQRQLDCWLRYVSLARKADKLSLARSTLRMLLGVSTEDDATIASKIASVEPAETVRDTPPPSPPLILSLPHPSHPHTGSDAPAPCLRMLRLPLAHRRA